MAAFTLHGKVQMDGSSVGRAFTSMRAAAAPAGKQIGTQLRSAMLSVIGAGAGIQLFRRTLENAFNIRREAGRNAVDTTTFQVLQRIADETGASITDLTDRLAEAGPAGDEFRDAVASAREEMLATGQVINEETVKRLAELKDRLNDIFARLAPGLSMLVDKLTSLYDTVSHWVERGVGAYMGFLGAMTGDDSLTEAGRQMNQPRQAEESTSRTGEAAREIGRQIARTAAEESRQDRNREPRSREQRAPSPFSVSGATAMGASFVRSPILTPMQSQLVLLNRKVEDIRKATVTGRLLD